MLVADCVLVDDDGGNGAESRSKFVTMFSRDGEVSCWRCEEFVETRLSGASCSSSMTKRFFDEVDPGCW